MNIILGVPGPWRNLDELRQAIAAAEPEYHLQDGLLIGLGQTSGLEWCEPDPELHRAFALANRQSLSRADLELIEKHAGCAYLICPGGSLEAGRTAMALASIILRAGGYGVRVETAGVALSAWDWLAQAERSHTHVGALYISFVSLINRHGQVYSCGMHNLGLPDATVVSQVPASSAGELLRGFLMSVVHEQPALISDQSTLNDGADNLYLLTHVDCALYEPDDPFFNPFGMWQLSLIEGN